ncbi:MAG: type II toxin-antitoxin system RelE/ParE family toxin [archaeon]
MESRVIFKDKELKDSFNKLKDVRLRKEIEEALNTLKQNAFFGRNVKKKLIPRELKQKYNLNNLWIYNLRKDWRLIYTLTNNEVEILAIVLDWMNHKEYERLFKF